MRARRSYNLYADAARIWEPMRNDWPFYPVSRLFVLDSRSFTNLVTTYANRRITLNRRVRT